MNITIANKPTYYAYPGMKGTLVSRAASKEAQNRQIDKVMNIVGQHFGITALEIMAHCRKRNRVEARMVFCYMCFNYVRICKSRIAEILKRDHTSVLHSLKTIRDLMDTDDRFKREVNLISAKYYD